jgi:hypothetical protein
VVSSTFRTLRHVRTSVDDLSAGLSLNARNDIYRRSGLPGLARDGKSGPLVPMSVEAKRTRVATILIVPYCTSPSLDPISRFSAVSTLHSPFLHNITEDQTHPLCVIGNSDLRDGYRESIVSSGLIGLILCTGTRFILSSPLCRSPHSCSITSGGCPA